MATDFLDLARQAYDASTTYIDANYRPEWDYSIKAFRSEHAPGSKYLSEEYKARSRIFHPKTRSIIRKNEAAAMHAAFSNRELVQTSPANPDNAQNVASAATLKEVIQYRLERTIPTFQVYLGGVQDAQATGVVCSYQYWEYLKKGDKVVKDKPCIELRPVENLRLDASASWTDPVNTSPYFCDIIPMHVCDVQAMMRNKNTKTGEPAWKKYDEKIIALARPNEFDSTRRARLGERQDPDQEQTGNISAFDVVWVLRWFMKDAIGDDYTYYTLGTERLLSDAKPLEEVYFHGVRPYVIGCSILETHKALKSSLPMLIKGLQQGINQIGNSRFDNVQFVLNKRWFVTRGRQTDVPSLVRNVPGGVTLTANAKEDVQESNWPDVTSSSYVEHDRMNAETDDLAGNFSASTRVANNAVNDTLGGSRMASAGAGLMTEYLLQTVNQTWWQPVLAQIGLLERYYETDAVILTICAQKAGLFPRFGPAQLEGLLEAEDVSVSVDMAMGDPTQRLQKFLLAINACIQIISTAPPGVNVREICKEICANAGYRDGERFFGNEDPRLAKAMQMLQQAKAMLEGKQMELQASAQETQAKIASDERQKAAQLQVDTRRIDGDLAIRRAELMIEEQRLELERLKLQMEARGADQELTMRAAEMQSDIDNAALKLEGEKQKQLAQSVQSQQDIEKSELDLQKSRIDLATAERAESVESETRESMLQIAREIAEIRSAMDASGRGVSSEVAELRKGLGAMAAIVMQPKKKPVSVSGGKKQGRIVIKFDDGSSEDVTVQ